MIVRAALSLLALRVGTSIAYPAIDYDIARVAPVTGSGVSAFDATNVIAGLSGFASAIFGGAPLAWAYRKSSEYGLNLCGHTEYCLLC